MSLRRRREAGLFRRREHRAGNPSRHRRHLADRVAAKLIAGLTRIVRDVGLAEELAQDALVIALKQWPETGCPDKPGAWLMATPSAPSTRFRRNKMVARKLEARLRDRDRAGAGGVPTTTALDDDIGDDLLQPDLHACHPVLSARRGWR
jgi:predicted RNA polymerase sigma factor